VTAEDSVGSRRTAWRAWVWENWEEQNSEEEGKERGGLRTRNISEERSGLGVNRVLA
jgi:hypothetical protein